MKMEHTLTAPHEGVVETLGCDVGDLVEEGVELAVVAPA
jgi:3-methylcrotonyl-CoA carboxylase alpha subunit